VFIPYCNRPRTATTVATTRPRATTPSCRFPSRLPPYRLLRHRSLVWRKKTIRRHWRKITIPSQQWRSRTIQRDFCYKLRTSRRVTSSCSSRAKFFYPYIKKNEIFPSFLFPEHCVNMINIYLYRLQSKNKPIWCYYCYSIPIEKIQNNRTFLT